MNKVNRTYIFDLDGTLFETDKLVLYAFKNTFIELKKLGYNLEHPNDQNILSIIGLVLDDIWSLLVPNLPVEVHHVANKLLLKNEMDGVKNGYGNLYPNVKETLQQLKYNGNSLYIASNGLEDYVTFILQHFDIDQLFDGIYTAGGYKTDKKEDLVRLLMNENNITNGIMIGDRGSDVRAGTSNGLYVIGCNYGFASTEELMNADYIIRSFEEIKHILVSTKVEGDNDGRSMDN